MSFAGETEATIYPTGTCFDDALDFLQIEARQKPIELLGHYRLAHGVCVDPDGVDYSHAWVEDVDEDEVIFGGIYHGERVYVRVSRWEFYVEQRVKTVTRYTVEQAWEENCKSGHFGPWEERYRQLCKDSGN